MRTGGRIFDQEWRDRFERFGRQNREDHAVSGWSREGLRRRVRLFEHLLEEVPLPTTADVLELGCGAGTYVRRLAGLGHRVVGLDYSLSTLERAREADPGRRGRYVAGDGYALPFLGESFDLVVSIGVLQALSGPERLLDEVARVVRSRGIVVVEALNAFAPSALAKRLRERALGRPPRVRSYVFSQIRRYLEERRIRVVHRAGVYVPPRRWPQLAGILDRPAVTSLLETVPGAALLAAHAFWFVGRKV